MKKITLLLIICCLALCACGRSKDPLSAEDTSYSQLVSVTYTTGSDLGDVVVKFLNSAAILQNIGIDAGDVGAIKAERVNDMEQPAENGTYNNVIRITIDTGDKDSSEELFNTFYDKAQAKIAELVRGENVTMEKIEE